MPSRGGAASVLVHVVGCVFTHGVVCACTHGVVCAPTWCSVCIRVVWCACVQVHACAGTMWGGTLCAWVVGCVCVWWVHVCGVLGCMYMYECVGTHVCGPMGMTWAHSSGVCRDVCVPVCACACTGSGERAGEPGSVSPGARGGTVVPVWVAEVGSPPNSGTPGRPGRGRRTCWSRGHRGATRWRQ